MSVTIPQTVGKDGRKEEVVRGRPPFPLGSSLSGTRVGGEVVTHTLGGGLRSRDRVVVDGRVRYPCLYPCRSGYVRIR